MTPRFQFGQIVVIDSIYVGVIVKSWGPTQSPDPARNGTYSYDVYVRSFNDVRDFREDEIKAFVYDKELPIDYSDYQ